MSTKGKCGEWEKQWAEDEPWGRGRKGGHERDREGTIRG